MLHTVAAVVLRKAILKGCALNIWGKQNVSEASALEISAGKVQNDASLKVQRCFFFPFIILSHAEILWNTVDQSEICSFQTENQSALAKHSSQLADVDDGKCRNTFSLFFWPAEFI